MTAATHGRADGIRRRRRPVTTGIAAAAFGLLAAVRVAAPQAAARSGEPAPGDVAALQPPATVILTHDNRDRAGVMYDKYLRVRLEIVRGVWRPEGEAGPARDVFAFAEEGKAPHIPGPLLRVPEGMDLQIAVRNRLSETVKIHGLVTRPASTDEFVEIGPGSVREFRFRAGAPGTYYYWGRTSAPSFGDRIGHDSQLTGALIVDPAGGQAGPDRIFVMGEWLERPTAPGPPVKVSLVINGRSWPNTERLSLPFGLAADWRVINASAAPHPMHLHGTFYTVESRGTAIRDTIYGASNRRLVTTELMLAGTTMTMRWVPDRVGNWLFHCHLLAHVSGLMRAGDAPASSVGDEAHEEHDPERAMAGLVLGITVQPGDETAAPDLEPHQRRRLTLHVRESPARYGADPGYGFSLVDGTQAPPALGVGAALSPPILLTKGEPVVVGVANDIHDAIAIHWHGIELESFNDGVPGWSGQSGNVMPPVKPGETFDVRFTPPRAGTFIYHTHGHGSRQLASGVYGPLIVLDPGKTFDPATDHIVLLGGSGPGGQAVEVNRSTNPPPLEIRAGAKHRFRFINITPNFISRVSLRGDAGIVPWRAVAKDGADLPPNQAAMQPANLLIGIGETYDFEIQPSAPGDLRLEVLRGGYLTTMLVRVVR